MKPKTYCDGSCRSRVSYGVCQKCFKPTREELELQMLDYKANGIFEQNKHRFIEIINEKKPKQLTIDNIIQSVNELNRVMQEAEKTEKHVFLEKLIAFMPEAKHDLKDKGIPSIIECSQDVWPTVDKYLGKYITIIPFKEAFNSNPKFNLYWLKSRPVFRSDDIANHFT